MSDIPPADGQPEQTHPPLTFEPGKLYAMPDADLSAIRADQPQTVTIRPSQDSPPLVTIHPDGHLEYGPNYDPDEAARTFWDAVQRIAMDPVSALNLSMIEAERDEAQTAVGRAWEVVRWLRIQADQADAGVAGEFARAADALDSALVGHASHARIVHALDEHERRLQAEHGAASVQFADGTITRLAEWTLNPADPTPGWCTLQGVLILARTWPQVGENVPLEGIDIPGRVAFRSGSAEPICANVGLLSERHLIYITVSWQFDGAGKVG